LSGPELVVFDIGSTLVDGTPSQPATRIADRLGLDPDVRRRLNTVLMTRPLRSVEEVALVACCELGIESPGLLAEVEEVWSAQECEAFPTDGALDVLEALVATGHRLALLSNIWQPYLTSVERHFGAFFAEHVAPELQLFSFRLGRMKPNPEVLQDLVDTAGVAARDAVMVGDTYTTDLAPAIAMGMKTVWVLHRAEREVTSLAGVVNGAEPAPTRAVASIAHLTPDVVASL
jgi:FMN phosphatase YigB (HAD superfamily)